jgi:hypothetical protein
MRPARLALHRLAAAGWLREQRALIVELYVHRRITAIRHAGRPRR